MHASTTAATSQTLLIRGGTVLTGHTDGSPGFTPERTDVLIEDGVIAGLARWDGPFDGDVVDASGCLVVPGFIDTHRHNWQTGFRGVAANWTLGQYVYGLHGRIKPALEPDDIRIGNAVGRLEALNAGITTMVDWSHSIRTDEDAFAALEGLRAVPGRSVFAYAPIFGLYTEGSVGNSLELMAKEFVSAHDDRVTLALALRGPQYSSIASTREDVQAARSLGLPVSVHGGSAGWGRGRPVGRMYEAGLLDERTTVVHGNTLADDELDMMREVGAAASVSPDAEVQMGFGWPATGRLLRAGIRPSLSIDDCAAVGGDMFRTMHSTLLIQRGLDNEIKEDPTDRVGLDLGCSDVLDFATRQGAAACGLRNVTGAIAVGLDADLLCVDAQDLSMFPANDPVSSMVASGHPGLVRDVFVRGEAVKRDGRIVGVDVDDLRDQLVRSRDAVSRRVLRAGEGDFALDGSWNPPTTGYTSRDNRPDAAATR